MPTFGRLLKLGCDWKVLVGFFCGCMSNIDERLNGDMIDAGFDKLLK